MKHVNKMLQKSRSLFEKDVFCAQKSPWEKSYMEKYKYPMCSLLTTMLGPESCCGKKTVLFCFYGYLLCSVAPLSVGCPLRGQLFYRESCESIFKNKVHIPFAIKNIFKMDRFFYSTQRDLFQQQCQAQQLQK